MTKRNRAKRALAVLLAVGSLAAAMPATSLADGGGNGTTGQSGGGTGP